MPWASMTAGWGEHGGDQRTAHKAAPRSGGAGVRFRHDLWKPDQHGCIRDNRRNQGGLSDGKKRERASPGVRGGGKLDDSAAPLKKRSLSTWSCCAEAHSPAGGGTEPFDGDGPGTSDPSHAGRRRHLAFFKATGCFVPGVHSRPLSDDDPDIAPALVPLRQRLMGMVGRPVNIQASREIVIQLRGDLIGQPYLELFRKPDGLSLNAS
jgi:hypothetical protein